MSLMMLLIFCLNFFQCFFMISVLCFISALPYSHILKKKNQATRLIEDCPEHRGSLGVVSLLCYLLLIKLITTNFFYQRTSNLRHNQSYSKCENIKIHPRRVLLIFGIKHCSTGLCRLPAASCKLPDSAWSHQVINS